MAVFASLTAGSLFFGDRGVHPVPRAPLPGSRASASDYRRCAIAVTGIEQTFSMVHSVQAFGVFCYGGIGRESQVGALGVRTVVNSATKDAEASSHVQERTQYSTLVLWGKVVVSPEMFYK